MLDPKCIYRKGIFAKCTWLACLLSFVSLLGLRHPCFKAPIHKEFHKFDCLVFWMSYRTASIKEVWRYNKIHDILFGHVTGGEGRWKGKKYCDGQISRTAAPLTPPASSQCFWTNWTVCLQRSTSGRWGSFLGGNVQYKKFSTQKYQRWANILVQLQVIDRIQA